MQVIDRNGRLKVEITNTVDDLSIGVTTISGGTNGRVLYDNAGILGELDLASTYVPYMGATADVDLGNHDLYLAKLWLYDEPVGGYGSVHLTDSVFHVEDVDGHSMLTFEDGAFTIANGPTIRALFNISGLTSNRDYVFPNASGTIALTSDLAGYVPISRTLTINGVTQDLTANRTFTISTGITIGTTAITSGTVGRVLFEGTGNVVSESANLFWDNTNGRLGINTSSPTNTLSIYRSGSTNYFNFEPSATGTAPYIQALWAGAFDLRFNVRNSVTVGGLGIDAGLSIFNQSSSANAGLVVGSLGVSGNASIGGGKLQLGSTTDNMLFFQQSGAATRGLIGYAAGQSYMQVRVNGATDFTNGTFSTAFFSTGNIGINTTTDAGFKADINGTMRVTGKTSLNGQLDTNQTGSGHAFVKVNDNGTVIRISNWNIGNPSGNVFVGGSEVASALFALNSTTLGFLPPRMTTTQKNAIASPATGLMVYDTTLNKLCVRTASAWETITSL